LTIERTKLWPFCGDFLGINGDISLLPSPYPLLGCVT
jgi:hypothetical protein